MVICEIGMCPDLISQLIQLSTESHIILLESF